MIFNYLINILIYYSNGGIFISLSEPLLEENLDVEGITLIYSSLDDMDLIDLLLSFIR